MQGKVEAQDTHKPIIGAVVEVMVYGSGAIAASGNTGLDGSYKLVKRLNGAYDIRASAKGYETAFLFKQSLGSGKKYAFSFSLKPEQPPDITPPQGSIQINNNTENNVKYTNSRVVNLQLSATDSGSGMGQGSQMRFSNDNVTWLTPENYVVVKAWTLTSGDGTKKVYVKFKDKAGNWSQVYSDSIILDTTAPVMKFILPLNESTVSAANEEAKL